ncbi:EAL domain-containing protein [Pseudomonas sp. PDM32]|nr:EAL domain-containing protein [Pseudomonas sp. PDM32]
MIVEHAVDDGRRVMLARDHPTRSRLRQVERVGAGREVGDHVVGVIAGQGVRAGTERVFPTEQAEVYRHPGGGADTRQMLHHKVLARLLDPQGEAIAAGHFLPRIERLGWSARLDLTMLEATLDDLVVNRRPLAREGRDARGTGGDQGVRGNGAIDWGDGADVNDEEQVAAARTSPPLVATVTSDSSYPSSFPM